MTAAAKLLPMVWTKTGDFAYYDEQDPNPSLPASSEPWRMATGIAVGAAFASAPNAAELIDACLMLIERKSTTTEELLEVMPGPDFPTGGTLVEMANILEQQTDGWSSAPNGRRRFGRGTWQIVVTEIPFQVQKGKLIERLAELIDGKKVPLLGDVRDESAEDIRLVLEPKSKTVDPDMLMESLFKLSDLENRFSMNLNVLDRGAPKVMGLKDVLLAHLAHRREYHASGAPSRQG